MSHGKTVRNLTFATGDAAGAVATVASDAVSETRNAVGKDYRQNYATFFLNTKFE